MSHSFSDLTDQQKDAYFATCARFGLEPRRRSSVLSEPHIAPFCISSDPLVSRWHGDLKVMMVPAVAAFKNLFGRPDQFYAAGENSDAFMLYPESLAEDRMAVLDSVLADPCALDAAVDDELLRAVRQACHAFVMGISSKVRSFEPLINALLFPMKVVVAAVDELFITPDCPLVIDGPDPVLKICGLVVVHPDAFIQINVETLVNAQKIISLSKDQSLPFKIAGQNGSPGPDGATGQVGPSGYSAIPGQSSGGKNPQCIVSPTPASRGGEGGRGTDGGMGGNGTMPGSFVIDVDQVVGILEFKVTDGNGGKGGKGGRGGSGGPGGLGCSAVSPCPGMPQGPGGRGGEGRNGRDGGDAANGVRILIQSKTTSNLNYTLDAKDALNPGAGGEKGIGGDPGAGGDASKGPDGSNGSPGRLGTPIIISVKGPAE